MSDVKEGHPHDMQLTDVCMIVCIVGGMEVDGFQWDNFLFFLPCRLPACRVCDPVEGL
jgi:hypothetical protein